MREIRPGGEGGGVRGSEDLLDGGEQCRVLVAGRRPVTRLPGEAGETRPGGEGGGVRGSVRVLPTSVGAWFVRFGEAVQFAVGDGECLFESFQFCFEFGDLALGSAAFGCGCGATDGFG